jgi:hypothetical protein
MWRGIAMKILGTEQRAKLSILVYNAIENFKKIGDWG